MAMSSTAGGVVLVVDDNEDEREGLARLLGLFGLAVETVADGREALEYLRCRPHPLLIVLDLRMPVMDGLDFLDARRGDPLLSLIPVIVHSAEPEWSVADALDDALFLPKGCDPMVLVRAVLALCA